MTNMSDATTDRWEAPSFPDSAMPTAGELEALQKQAYDEAFGQAYDEGKAAGFAEGMAAAETETKKRAALLDDMVSHLRSPLSEMDDVLESQLVRMVLSLVGRLFRRQIDLDPDAIKGLVRDAVRMLPAATDPVEILVHPEDVERLKAIVADDTNTDAAARWSLIKDPSITPGGCRVTCNRSHVDATVEARIEAIANSLVGDERS